MFVGRVAFLELAVFVDVVRKLTPEQCPRERVVDAVGIVEQELVEEQ